MTDVNIGSGEISKIRLKVQGSNPTGDPESGYAWLFEKADGLYIEKSDGTVLGPFTDDSHEPVTVSDTATLDLSLSGQQVSGAVNPAGIKLDDLGTPDDNTDLNASASRHGLLPKLPNDDKIFKWRGRIYNP